MMCSSLIKVKTIVDIVQRYLPTKTIRYYIGYDGDMLKDDEGDIINQCTHKNNDSRRGINNVILETQLDLLITHRR